MSLLFNMLSNMQYLYCHPNTYIFLGWQYKCCYSSFLLISFAWDNFFHSITFSLIYLDLKWVSCRIYMCVCACVWALFWYPASLCLLIGAFILFTWGLYIVICINMLYIIYKFNRYTYLIIYYKDIFNYIYSKIHHPHLLFWHHILHLCFVSTLTTDCGYRWFCYFYLPTSCITNWSTSLTMHMSLTMRFFFS